MTTLRRYLRSALRNTANLRGQRSHSCLRVLSLLGASVGLCREVSAQADATNSALVDHMACTSFAWSEWKGVSPKGAMLIPVEIAGKTSQYQFDTGAGRSRLFGKGNPSLDSGSTSARLSNVGIGGTMVSSLRVDVDPNAEFDSTFAGTIGLDVVIGNLTVIDFPRQKFCVARPGDVDPALLGRVLGTKAIIRDGRFFVQTTVNGHPTDSLFYDSGSSAMALSVDFTTWADITGAGGERNAERVIMGNAFGKQIKFVGAQTKGTFAVGPLDVGAQLAFYRSEPLDFFARFIPEASGNFGNMPFFNDIVVINATQFPGFGILASPRTLTDASGSVPISSLVNVASVLVNTEVSESGRTAVVAGLMAQYSAHGFEPKLGYQLGKAGALWGLELDAAEAALRRYVQMSPAPGAPSQASAYWRLGAVLERKGARAAAIEAYATAVEKDPGQVEAKRALSRLRP